MISRSIFLSVIAYLFFCMTSLAQTGEKLLSKIYYEDGKLKTSYEYEDGMISKIYTHDNPIAGRFNTKTLFHYNDKGLLERSEKFVFQGWKVEETHFYYNKKGQIEKKEGYRRKSKDLNLELIYECQYFFNEDGHLYSNEFTDIKKNELRQYFLGYDSIGNIVKMDIYKDGIFIKWIEYQFDESIHWRQLSPWYCGNQLSHKKNVIRETTKDLSGNIIFDREFHFDYSNDGYPESQSFLYTLDEEVTHYYEYVDAKRK